MDQSFLCTCYGFEHGMFLTGSSTEWMVADWLNFSGQCLKVRVERLYLKEVDRHVFEGYTLSPDFSSLTASDPPCDEEHILATCLLLGCSAQEEGQETTDWNLWNCDSKYPSPLCIAFPSILSWRHKGEVRKPSPSVKHWQNNHLFFCFKWLSVFVMGEGMRVPRNKCGGQRMTCGSWISPSTMWVSSPWGSNSHG